MNILVSFSILILSLVAIGGTQAQNIDKTTVKKVDLEKYMGKWYEIARYDHSFERDLVGVTATYSLLPNNRIRVVNEGYKHTLNGSLKSAVGKAKVPDMNEPGKLKVSFFLWFYSDYYILELAEDYSYALIGSSSDNYLWILSRTPVLPEVTLKQILDKAQKRGYDTEKLIFVKQQ
ncbi:MAG TPA: lipocalin [Porphyromonadaceae bacterium]|nr:lipocalin [Porphyromonadaceae bacterium]